MITASTTQAAYPPCARLHHLAIGPPVQKPRRTATIVEPHALPAHRDYLDPQAVDLRCVDTGRVRPARRAAGAVLAGRHRSHLPDHHHRAQPVRGDGCERVVTRGSY